VPHNIPLLRLLTAAFCTDQRSVAGAQTDSSLGVLNIRAHQTTRQWSFVDGRYLSVLDTLPD
jgi:hypothetical protein